MSNLLKTFAVIFATAGIMCMASANDAPKAVPGAEMYVYSITDLKKPTSDADPLAVVVDKSEDFSKGNLRRNSETSKFRNQSVFIVWKGYIAIPQRGVYTFALSYNDPCRSYDDVFFQINGKDFLDICLLPKSKYNDSRSLLLDKGHYEIKIINRCPNSHDFSIKMWNKARPLKKAKITPAIMVHAE